MLFITLDNGFWKLRLGTKTLTGSDIENTSIYWYCRLGVG